MPISNNLSRTVGSYSKITLGKIVKNIIVSPTFLFACLLCFALLCLLTQKFTRCLSFLCRFSKVILKAGMIWLRVSQHLIVQFPSFWDPPPQHTHQDMNFLSLSRPAKLRVISFLLLDPLLSREYNEPNTNV